MTDSQLIDLAIALNASARLHREAICRLSAAPQIWLEAPRRRLGEVARELRVSTEAIRRALDCALDAERRARIETERAERLGASLITRHAAAYPKRLLDLELPPPVLYVLGRLSERPAASIVGSRNADAYGIEAAETFAAELAASGLTIASGLALGVDSAAHRGALAVGGHTLAVLGCGIDIDYPRSNRRLRAKIAEHGTIVSEFPIGTAPERRHFPIRNRIIAALGCGTLVIRATPRSGSLITAGCALTLGRLVWAIPGNIFDSRSIGPNSLIRDGAHPVQSASEIIETLPTAVQTELDYAPDGASRSSAPVLERSDLATLFGAIPAGETADTSALVESTGLGLDAVLSRLVELEIMGLLVRYPGPVWGRSGSPPSRTGPG